MTRWHFLGLAAIAALMSSAPSRANAQAYGGTRVVQQQPQQQKQELHGKGEFDAVGNGGLIAELDGARWLLKFEQKPKVIVSGTATVEALAPGMFVKFKGEFDKKGKASAEINDLEIFTPNEKEPLGATPSGASPFDSPMPKKGPATTPTAYDIAGRITSIKKNSITVACPGMTVHGDLAPEAAITVNVADLTFASPGDKIEVRGWYAKGQEGRGYATEVQVQLSNQLTGPKKRGAHPAAKTGDKTADKATDKSGDADAGDKTKKPADSKTAAGKAADAKKAAADKKANDAKADSDKPDAAKPDGK